MIPKAIKAALVAAVIAPVTLTSAPATAQSISYAVPSLAIMRSTARTNGYAQISQTYASNIQSIQQKSTERQNVLATLDTNGDNAVNDAELDAASQNSLQQLQTIEDEMNNLQQPIQLARLYVLEQIQGQYETAQAEVVKKNKINVILQPDSFVYMPDSANVTTKLTNELNSRFPQAQTTPPANWQPARSTASLYAEIEEMLQLDAYLNAMRQAQQQQAAGATAAPAAAPATPAPASEQR